MKTLFTLCRSATLAGNLTGLTFLAFLTGCAVGPNYVRPALTLPEHHTEQGLAVAAEPAGVVTQVVVPNQDIPAQWWELFHSPTLNALVELSLKNNPDIQAAQAALRSAQENVSAQQGAFFPTVSAEYNGSRQKIAPVLASPTSSNYYLFNLHTAQLNISYMPDVFGLNRRTVESLQAQADIQRYALQATYLTLTSNLVNAALNEAALRSELAALQSIADSQNKVLEMVRRLVKLGQSGQLDLAAQESASANADAALPPVQKQLALQRDQIKALCGKFPDDTRIATFTLADLHLPESLPLTLPSSLLEHRPDILAAEAQLQAASANVGIATANRLPAITLGVNAYGSSAFSLGDLFKSGTSFWTLAGGITQPLLDGGALRHRERAAQAALEQAQAQYRGTVTSAFQNVADALQAIQADAVALQAAQRAEQAARNTAAIARQQLALGDISPLTMLGIEQNSAQARLAYIQANAARYSDTVALFAALGGGWWNQSATTNNSEH